MQIDFAFSPFFRRYSGGSTFRRLCVALVALVGIASTASADMMLYWTDKGADQKKIYRGSFDGSTMEVVAEVGPYADSLGDMSKDLRGLTVDDVNGTVYFTTQYRDMCRVDLDGNNLERLVKYDAATYGNRCREMAVDPANHLVYWATFTGSSDSGSICRSDPDFTNIEKLTDDVYPRTIGLDLDLTAGKMYWSTVHTAQVQDGAIYRANLDGTNVETVVTGLVTPRGLELDVEGGKMYWVDGNTGDAFDGLVQCANLDGTGVQTLVTGEDEVTGLTVSHEAGKVFWTDIGLNTIRSCNLDGSGIETLADAASLGISNDLRGITVDPVHGNVYFNTQAREVCRVGLDGSNPELLFQADSGFGQRFREMNVDPLGGNLYWVVFRNGGGVCRTDLDFSGRLDLRSRDSRMPAEVDSDKALGNL